MTNKLAKISAVLRAAFYFRTPLQKTLATDLVCLVRSCSILPICNHHEQFHAGMTSFSGLQGWNQLSPSSTNISLYACLRSEPYTQCSCIPLPSCFAKWLWIIQEGIDLQWKWITLYHNFGSVFYYYSVRNIPDGVNPEKYNYTYSPCLPVVCNSTTGHKAAVSEIMLFFVMHKKGCGL